MDDDQKQQPESLLPYEKWIDQALRQVVAQAIAYVGDHGLPGGHHFYLTFRTSYPGVEIPARLKAQYPQEMTIVLQHQFWDLGFDQENDTIRVGLSFGGVPSKLAIPLAAVVEFADPSIRYGLRFQPEEAQPEDAAPVDSDTEQTTPMAAAEDQKQTEVGQVVRLDAFRRRSPQ